MGNSRLMVTMTIQVFDGVVEVQTVRVNEGQSICRALIRYK